VHLFGTMSAISSREVGDFFSAWRVVTLHSANETAVNWVTSYGAGSLIATPAVP